jgi:hypothetical protein
LFAIFPLVVVGFELFEVEVDILSGHGQVEDLVAPEDLGQVGLEAKIPLRPRFACM